MVFHLQQIDSRTGRKRIMYTHSHFHTHTCAAYFIVCKHLNEADTLHLRQCVQWNTPCVLLQFAYYWWNIRRYIYRRCRYHLRCRRRRHRCSASLSKRMGQLKQFLYNSDNGSSFNYVHLNFQINSAIDLFCLWTFFRCCYLYVQSRNRQSDAGRHIHTQTYRFSLEPNSLSLWWNHCKFPISSAIKAIETTYTRWIFHCRFDRCSFRR